MHPMTRMRMGAAAVALLVFGSVGCSSPPQAEIEAARAAIESARQADAGTWAAQELKTAEDSLAAAEAEVAAQSGRWFKGYGRARDLAAQAKQQAESAAAAAAANRERARSESEAAIGAADAALKTAEGSLKAAPATRYSKADRALFRNEISKLAPVLQEARTAFEIADYRRASQLADSVRDGANDIATRLQRREARPAPK